MFWRGRQISPFKQKTKFHDLRSRWPQDDLVDFPEYLIIALFVLLRYVIQIVVVLAQIGDSDGDGDDDDDDGGDVDDDGNGE